jgi:glycine/D-amino acid oxidase-like deaminating enzyme
VSGGTRTDPATPLTIPRPTAASRPSQGVEVIIVGAGVIGLTTALTLADEGRRVVLIDPAPPGSGASYGNAGTIADYATAPVGTPAVLRDLPRLLIDRHSPLAIHRPAFVSLVPWLTRFLYQSLPSRASANAAALAALLSDATPLWAALADRIGARALMQDRGCLYLYATEAEGRAATSGLAARRALGVEVDQIDATALAALEPGLPPMPGGAAFFRNAQFITDPGAMMAALTRAAQVAGVEVMRGRVTHLERTAVGVVAKGPGLLRTARTVVVAAGARSRALARIAGDRVPLDTERGYHLEWDMPRPPVTRPACPVSRGFYLCPMQGRLRVAGTVELGGLDAPPSPHRLQRLAEGARALLPDLGEPDRTWMGLRPSMPDSLPVIGPSKGGAQVIHAFGHGHIGLTLAPRTAAFVADLIAGRDPGPALAPCLPARF